LCGFFFGDRTVTTNTCGVAVSWSETKSETDLSVKSMSGFWTDNASAPSCHLEKLTGKSSMYAVAQWLKKSFGAWSKQAVAKISDGR
jgi:hypothetical protein